MEDASVDVPHYHLQVQANPPKNCTKKFMQVSYQIMEYLQSPTKDLKNSLTREIGTGP